MTLKARSFVAGLCVLALTALSCAFAATGQHDLSVGIAPKHSLEVSQVGDHYIIKVRSNSSRQGWKVLSDSGQVLLQGHAGNFESELKLNPAENPDPKFYLVSDI